MTASNGTNGHAAAAVQWDADMLTGKKDYPHDHAGLPSPSRRRLLGRRGKDKDGKPDPGLWGIPGHMTEDEVAVFLKFRDEMEKRDGEFRKTIFSFGEIEDEAFTLSRWLRARKFVLSDVLQMVEEATECRATPRQHDFYPNVDSALGCDAALYYALYPQIYTGMAKNGAPLFISKPGILNVDGMECITTLDGILKFHWHVMIHDFAKKLKKCQEADPTFKRFECFCVLDLAHLTIAQLGSRSQAIIKEQSFIDSLCFPETLSKMIVVNAPRFFSATWRVIRGWLDVRTASKVEVISSRSASEKRLNELVECHRLPADYGGKGPTTIQTIAESYEGGMTRLDTDTLYLRGHGSSSTEVKADEELEIEVWTRNTLGATFSVMHPHQPKGQPPFVAGVEVKCKGSSEDAERPSKFTITTTRIAGPTKVKVKGDSHAGRFTTANFLVAYRFYKK